MIRKTLREIEKMVEGNGLSHTFYENVVRGVSVDSRTVKHGNLFIPIVREKDGHDYVDEAISNGASALLWQADHKDPPKNVPIIFVDDCLKALQILAAKYREQLSTKVIGITGSNGKTTTKDLIASILETEYRVHKTKGNLNSQIGVPLTVLEIEENTDWAVIELGMSERHQIERLSNIVKPDISIITMIGVSHLSTLGSRKEIAAAKMEIVSGMKDGGLLIYYGDEKLLENEINALPKKHSLEFIRFGESHSNDYYAESIQSDIDGSAFTIGSQRYYLPLMGKHNISNALAAILVAKKAGISPQNIVNGLQNISVTGMRLEKLMSAKGFMIINDAWNASPVSVSAAVETFEELAGFKKKYLVLGDMLELGDKERDYHEQIGELINPLKIDFLYTVGELSRFISSSAKQKFDPDCVKHFDDKDALSSHLAAVLEAGDAVLVKGSRGMEMEDIVNRLLQL